MSEDTELLTAAGLDFPDFAAECEARGLSPLAVLRWAFSHREDFTSLMTAFRTGEWMQALEIIALIAGDFPLFDPASEHGRLITAAVQARDDAKADGEILKRLFEFLVQFASSDLGKMLIQLVIGMFIKPTPAPTPTPSPVV